MNYVECSVHDEHGRTFCTKISFLSEKSKDKFSYMAGNQFISSNKNVVALQFQSMYITP